MPKAPSSGGNRFPTPDDWSNLTHGIISMGRHCTRGGRAGRATEAAAVRRAKLEGGRRPSGRKDTADRAHPRGLRLRRNNERARTIRWSPVPLFHPRRWAKAWPDRCHP